MEYLDIVDEHDNVIGQEEKRRAHELGLRHRVVHVHVFRPDGKVILQRRSFKKEHGGGLIDASVGGHVQAGESYEDAAMREMHEELGITSAIVEGSYFEDICPPVENQHGYAFHCVHEGPVKTDPEETDEILILAPTEVAELIEQSPDEFTPGFRDSWKNFRLAKRPKAAVAAIAIQNGKVLLGRRLYSNGAGTWCFPGGHMEYGETFEQTATRETLEESGLTLDRPRLFSVTNDFFPGDVKHYVTVFVVGEAVGFPVVKEPEKQTDWQWFPWDELPRPLFLPIENLLKQGKRPDGL